MKFLPLLLLGISLSVQAKTIKVAVIDTGYDFKSTWNKNGLISRPKLCPNGHYDFVNNNNIPMDNHGHGTHIAGIITQGNESVPYCLVILKYFDSDRKKSNNILNMVLAYREAIEQKVDIINVSGGGVERSEYECELVKQALDQGIKVIAAAGNEHQELNHQPFYPAMCDGRVIKVVNVSKNNEILKSSNRDSSGRIPNVVKAYGENIYSLLPGNNFGLMTGTSQSTANVTREVIRHFNDDLLIKQRYFQK